jgi:hypothetical protein
MQGWIGYVIAAFLLLRRSCDLTCRTTLHVIYHCKTVPHTNFPKKIKQASAAPSGHSCLVYRQE